MDKMKMQDVQLMQASGDTTSTVDDWSSVPGTSPTAYGTNNQGTANEGGKDHLGRAGRSTRVELFTPIAMRRLPSTCMIGSSLIHVHQLISFVINP